MTDGSSTRPVEDFRCPHCGAMYKVTFQEAALPNHGQALCEACKNVMAEWTDIQVPAYRLSQTPEQDG